MKALIIHCSPVRTGATSEFVKDFCMDNATKIFDDRLRAAASLWKIVRDSDMKKYSHELFKKYKDSITI